MLTIRGTAEEIEMVKSALQDMYTRCWCGQNHVICNRTEACENCVERNINWEVMDDD